MAGAFADKFEDALADKRVEQPGYGLRTLARQLAKEDPEKVETIRRRLNKYRPKPGGGAAEVAPTEPTRREIEKAMGLPVDALRPDDSQAAASGFGLLFEDLIGRAVDAKFEALLSRSELEAVRA